MMTTEMAKNYVKTIEFLSACGDIDDYALHIFKALITMQEQNNAIIALLQDINGAVNELLPFPD